MKESMMNAQHAVVAIYDTHSEAEDAVKELHRSGFDMRKLSIVDRDYHTEEHVAGYYNTGDRMRYWGKKGAFWGGRWGLRFGAAFFAIPGLGPVVVAGPVVRWIVVALEGAVIVGSVSALGAGLASIGIPHDSIIRYEKALKADKFLIVAHGSWAEVAQVKSIVDRTRVAEATLHQA
jgi:hypothetical protein